MYPDPTAGGHRVSRFRIPFAFSLAVLLPSLTGGCAVAVIGGLAGAGAAGYAAGQERGVSGDVHDFTTKTNIQVAWMKATPSLPSNLDVTVYDGRALLTGVVGSPGAKAEAGRLAQGVAGVRALYNQIEVAPGESAWDMASDAWITAKLRSDLILDKRIRSLNYTVETVKGSVYLIGSARTQGELERATSWARNIPGVRRVMSFVEVRPGGLGAPAVAQQAAPPAPATAQAPIAAPTVPVEAQRL